MGGDRERRTRNEIRRELIDSVDEELEMELDDVHNPDYLRSPVPKKMYVPPIY